MKTITLVANEPYHALSGGIPRFLQEIVPRLSCLYKVQVAVIGNSKQLQIEELSSKLTLYHFPHYAMPVGDSYPPRFLKKEIKKLIQASDVVFVQTVDCVVPLYYCQKLKKPLLMYFHGIDWETFPRAIGLKRLEKFVSPLVRAYARYWYNRCACLLLPSPSMLSVLQKAKIVSLQHILPLGVDGKKFKPADDKIKAKQALGFEAEDLVLGYTGRLAREKNIDFLLSLFARLQKRFENLKLLLVGNGVKDFESQISSNPAIKAVGQHNEVLPFLHAMDVFVMPSLTETSSLSSMEAMFTALPVVAFEVGCLKDYIFTGKNGFLIPFESEDCFYEKVSLLLETRDLRIKMSEEAKRTMQGRFDWDETVKKLSEVIEMLSTDA